MDMAQLQLVGESARLRAEADRQGVRLHFSMFSPNGMPVAYDGCNNDAILF